MNKRGQGLPLNVLIIAILVVIVLVVLVTIFLSGTAGLTKTIRDIFGGTIAGTDKSIAVESCKNRCNQAELLSKEQQATSAFCKKPFNIDDNLDGEADFVKDADGKKIYNEWYCSPGTGTRDPAANRENLGVGCSITCP